MAAAEPARLGLPIGGRFERRDGDPALVAQAQRRGRGRCRAAAAGGVAASVFGQCPQNRVGIEREAGRRLGRGRVAGLIAAAAAQLAARPAGRGTAGEKREADAGVVFEAAVLDRVDGYLEIGAASASPSSTAPSRTRSARARGGRSSRSSAASAASAGPAAASNRPSNSPASPGGGRDRGGVLVVERRAQDAARAPRRCRTPRPPPAPGSAR